MSLPEPGRHIPGWFTEASVSQGEKQPSEVRRILGFWLTMLGGALLAVWILDQTAPLPWSMPRSWYVHRTLWGLFGPVLAVTGLWMQSSAHSESQPRDWQPTRSGRRFTRMILYTREGCHLCESAAEQLAAHADHLPELETVDIEDDPALRERYGLCIPVVEIDGQVRFRGKIDEALLRRLIENTPPLGAQRY